MFPMMNIMTPKERLFRRPNQSEVLLVSLTLTVCAESTKDSLSPRQGSDQGADTHQRDQQGLNDRNKLVGLPRRSWFTSCESVTLMISFLSFSVEQYTNKVREDQHSRDLSSVVTKEETSYGGHYPKKDTFDTTFSAIYADGSIVNGGHQIK